jgi:transposase InsO family protein
LIKAFALQGVRRGKVWSGWVYVAFVTDAYARRILGLRTSTSMTTQLVLDAVEHAIWTRGRHGVADLGRVIHHTDYAGVCVKPRVCGDGLRSWELLVDFSA